MPFQRPTLRQIIDRIESDYKDGLGLQALLRRGFLKVFARAKGGASHTLHGHIQYGIEEKFFPDTGDEETVLRWGALYQLDRNPAILAEIIIDVTGTTGNTLTAGSVYVREDGQTYTVKDDVVVPAASTVQATIVAFFENNEENTGGADANLEAGDTVTLQSAISGIDSIAAFNATSIEGENLEDIEDYRVRVLERLQDPPSGGTVTDFIRYAKKVSGVTRVWVLPNWLGPGTVGVTFVEDDEDPIIPDAAKVAEVQAQLLEDEPQGTGGSTAFAPNTTSLDLDIAIKPNTPEVQAAVEAEIDDLLAREAQVRDAVDPDRVGEGVTFDGKIELSKIREAISIAAGEDDNVLNSPIADVQPAIGGLVVKGTITFSTLP